MPGELGREPDDAGGTDEEGAEEAEVLGHDHVENHVMVRGALRHVEALPLEPGHAHVVGVEGDDGDVQPLEEANEPAVGTVIPHHAVVHGPENADGALRAHGGLERAEEVLGKHVQDVVVQGDADHVVTALAEPEGEGAQPVQVAEVSAEQVHGVEDDEHRRRAGPVRASGSGELAVAGEELGQPREDRGPDQLDEPARVHGDAVVAGEDLAVRVPPLVGSYQPGAGGLLRGHDGVRDGVVQGQQAVEIERLGRLARSYVPEELDHVPLGERGQEQVQRNLGAAHVDGAVGEGDHAGAGGPGREVDPVLVHVERDAAGEGLGQGHVLGGGVGLERRQPGGAVENDRGGLADALADLLSDVRPLGADDERIVGAGVNGQELEAGLMQWFEELAGVAGDDHDLAGVGGGGEQKQREQKEEGGPGHRGRYPPTGAGRGGGRSGPVV